MENHQKGILSNLINQYLHPSLRQISLIDNLSNLQEKFKFLSKLDLMKEFTKIERPRDLFTARRVQIIELDRNKENVRMIADDE